MIVIVLRQVLIPTLDLARGFFDPDLENIDDSVIDKPFEVKRDQHMLALEAAKLSQRETAAEALPKVLTAYLLIEYNSCLHMPFLTL